MSTPLERALDELAPVNPISLREIIAGKSVACSAPSVTADFQGTAVRHELCVAGCECPCHRDACVHCGEPLRDNGVDPLRHDNGGYRLCIVNGARPGTEASR